MIVILVAICVNIVRHLVNITSQTDRECILGGAGDVVGAPWAGFGPPCNGRDDFRRICGLWGQHSKSDRNHYTALHGITRSLHGHYTVAEVVIFSALAGVFPIDVTPSDRNHYAALHGHYTVITRYSKTYPMSPNSIVSFTIKPLGSSLRCDINNACRDTDGTHIDHLLTIPHLRATNVYFQ